MTFKKKMKNGNRKEISEILFENKWSKPSVKTYNQQRKYCFNQKYLRLLISEIDYMVTKKRKTNKSKKFRIY